MARALFVLTRDPAGPQTGRKAAIWTALRCFSRLGYETEVVVLTRASLEDAAYPPNVNVRRVPPPGVASVALNVAIRASRARLSLNECLYFSDRLARTIRGLAATVGADVVVADMIRTWELARAAGPPVILDLDDILSERYSDLTGSRRAPRQVLGYYANYLPAGLAGPAGWLAAKLLGVEARLLAGREVTASRSAAVVALVSVDDAAKLSARVGRRVYAAGISMEMGEGPTWRPRADHVDGSTAPAAVFVGGLDYLPNREAAEWFAGPVVSAAAYLGMPVPQLHILGSRGSRNQDAGPLMRSPDVVCHGYVDDLPNAVARYDVFAAPLLRGGGVKTKVVEAMVIGIPVVTTTKGASGLRVESGRHCLIADTAEDFARALHWMIGHPSQAAVDGRRGPPSRCSRLLP